MKLKRIINPKIDIDQCIILILAMSLLGLAPLWNFLLSLLYGLMFESKY